MDRKQENTWNFNFTVLSLFIIYFILFAPHRFPELKIIWLMNINVHKTINQTINQSLIQSKDVLYFLFVDLLKCVSLLFYLWHVTLNVFHVWDFYSDTQRTCKTSRLSEDNRGCIDNENSFLSSFCTLHLDVRDRTVGFRPSGAHHPV